MKKARVVFLMMFAVAWGRATLPTYAEYRSEGEAFVTVNGPNRFTRALYGTCSAGRIETSDIPEMSFCTSRERARTIELPTLASFARCEARYEDGLRRYVLTDEKKIGGGRIEAVVTAAADREGGVMRIVATGLAAPFDVTVVEGPAAAKKFFRNGDYGRDPSSSYFVAKDARAKGTRTSGSSIPGSRRVPPPPANASQSGTPGPTSNTSTSIRRRILRPSGSRPGRTKSWSAL